MMFDDAHCEIFNFIVDATHIYWDFWDMHRINVINKYQSKVATLPRNKAPYLVLASLMTSNI